MQNLTDILTAFCFPLGELQETTSTPSYYVDEDYPAGHEIQQPLRERSNWRGSESSTLETDVYVWCYALLVVQVRKDEEVVIGHCQVSCRIWSRTCVWS